MADSHRQSVRGIGLGCFRQPQQRLEHLLHLSLFSPALADNRLFNLQSRVFGHRQPGIYRCDNRRTAGLTQLEGALDIVGKEDIFDGNLIWAILFDNGREPVKDCFQATGKVAGTVGEDSTVIDMHKLVAMLFDNAVTGYA